ncbi:hypothetical protein Aperf_G00000001122 [Anoplocephala perfoliata]
MYCPKGMRYEMVGFKWNNTKCYVEYELEANEDVMKKNPICYENYRYMIMFALDIVWGYPWGCDSSYARIHLTHYYAVWRAIPNVRTISELGVVKEYCRHPLLPSNTTFDVICRMNPFGGYGWVETNEGGCFIKELNIATDEAMNLIQMELKGKTAALKFRSPAH